jgi:hypothetical protein
LEKLNLCVARQKLCFACFDEPQEMDPAGLVPGNNRPPVWSDNATNDVIFCDEGRHLFPAFHVPEAQR